MSVRNIDADLAASKLNELFHLHRYDDCVLFVNRLSPLALLHLLPNLPIDAYLARLPYTIELFESLYAKVFIHDPEHFPDRTLQVTPRTSSSPKFQSLKIIFPFAFQARETNRQNGRLFQPAAHKLVVIVGLRLGPSWRRVPRAHRRRQNARLVRERHSRDLVRSTAAVLASLVLQVRHRSSSPPIRARSRLVESEFIVSQRVPPSKPQLSPPPLSSVEFGA